MPPETFTARRRKANFTALFSNFLATSKGNGFKLCFIVLLADTADPMEAIPLAESYSTRLAISTEQLLLVEAWVAAQHTNFHPLQAGRGRKLFFTTSHATHTMEPIQRVVLSLTPPAICMA